jgi:hypothetical protein
MRNVWQTADRAAGRVYMRMVAVVTGITSAGMLVLAAIFWAVWSPLGGSMWLVGALVFGLIARSCWRSRARLSDIDLAG